MQTCQSVELCRHRISSTTAAARETCDRVFLLSRASIVDCCQCECAAASVLQACFRALCRLAVKAVPCQSSNSRRSCEVSTTALATARFDAAVKRAQRSEDESIARCCWSVSSALSVCAVAVVSVAKARLCRAFALSTRCVRVGLRSPGDGSHSAAA